MRLNLRRKPACQILSKVLDISSASAQVALDLLKARPILSDTTVRGSAIGREDLTPCWESEIRPHFSMWSNRVVIFNPKILQDRDRRCDLPTIWNKKFHKTHIEEFNQYMKVQANRLTLLHNHHWNIIRIWRLLRIKVDYELANHLSANSTKSSYTLKKFVGNLTMNCLCVFDHFVGLALKGLTILRVTKILCNFR